MRTGKIKWISLLLFVIVVMAAATVTASAQTQPQEVSDWAAFEEIMSADGEAHVILTGDVKQEKRIEIKGVKTLDLNGHTYDSRDRQRGFVVLGTLTVKDSSGDDSGQFIGGWEKGIVVPNGAHLIIHGGTFYTGCATGYCLLWIEPGGLCSMDGGVLRNSRNAAILKEGDGDGGGKLELGGTATIIKNDIGIDAQGNHLITKTGDQVFYSNVILKKGTITVDQNNQNIKTSGRIGEGHGDKAMPIQVRGDITGSRIGVGKDAVLSVGNYRLSTGYAEHNTAPVQACFFSDLPEYSVIEKNGELVLTGKKGGNLETVTAGSWEDLADVVAKAGETGKKTTIKISGSFSRLDEHDPIVIESGADIVLDLQGKEIFGRDLTGGRLFENKGNLTITSSGGKGCLYGGRAVSEAESTGSEAGSGGAIYNEGSLSIDNVDLYDNQAAQFGGAIYNAPSGTLALTGCDFHDNKAADGAKGHGADIYNKGVLRMGDSSKGSVTIRADEIFLAEETQILITGGLNPAEKAEDKIGVIPQIINTQTDPEQKPVPRPFTRNYSDANASVYPGDCFTVADPDLTDYSVAWDDSRREAVFLDDFSGKVIITYAPNGGQGDPFTVEEEMNYRKAYVVLAGNRFAPPSEDMEFAGWLVGGEVCQAGELVPFDRDSEVKAFWKSKPALTIVSTSVDGTGEEAQGLPESLTIDGIGTGTTVRDALKEENGQYKKEITDHFVKEGYTLARFLPQPLESYQTWADMPSNSDGEEFMSTAITEDTVIFAVMAKTLDEASLEIEQPVCGSAVVKNEDGNPSTAENSPNVSLPEDAAYSMQDPRTAIYNKYWTTGRAGNPFYGTVQGAPMRAHIRLIPKAGYVFTSEPEMNIEGGSYINEGFSPWDGGNYILAMDVSVPIKHPNMEEVAAKDATCTEDGNGAQWICGACGTYFKDADASEAYEAGEWVIPAKGHTEGEPVKENVVAATCTGAASYDLVTHCTVCNKELSKETVQQPALGHMWTGTPRWEGESYTVICSRCHEQKVIPAREEEHVHGRDMTKVEEVPATCTETGVRAYWECSCGALFEDENAQTELDLYDLQIPAKEHTPSEPVTTVQKRGSCTEGGTILEQITCTECGTVISSKSTFVPAGKGWDKGHTWDEGKVVKEATTSAEGEMLLTCKVCGKEMTEVIPKLAKKAQPMKVKAKSVKVKAKKLKKKNQNIARKKAMTVSGAQGKVTYKKVKVNKKKYARKFTVNKKTGKITVKKGVKKGTYKLTVKVSAAGNADYEAGSRNVTVKIRVK